MVLLKGQSIGTWELRKGNKMTEYKIAEKDLWNAIKTDKKRVGNNVTLILPTAIGTVIPYPVELPQ